MNEFVKKIIINEIFQRKPFEEINHGKSDKDNFLLEMIIKLYTEDSLNFEVLNALADAYYAINEERVVTGKELEKRSIDYFYKEMSVYPHLIACITEVLMTDQVFYDQSLNDWNGKLNGEDQRQEYRTRNLSLMRDFNSVTQKTGHFHPLLPAKFVPEAMAHLIGSINELLDNCDQYSEDEYIKELARIKYRLLKIHPFSDGNGRVSRLLLNYLGLKKGFFFDYDLAKIPDSTPIFEVDRIISFELPAFENGGDYQTLYLKSLVKSPETIKKFENNSLHHLYEFLKQIRVNIPIIKQNQLESIKPPIGDMKKP